MINNDGDEKTNVGQAKYNKIQIGQCSSWPVKEVPRTAGVQVHDKHAGARDNDKHTNKVLMHQGRDGSGEVPLEALLNSSILYEGCAHIFENKEAQREYFEAPRVTTEDNC